jgi:cephalosporin-C deacetylase-like acetyl esterase
MTLCSKRRPMKWFLILAFLSAFVSFAAASDAPPADAFRVLPPPGKEAPIITPYLQYQVDMAWKQDEQRLQTWRGVRTEAELLAVQRTIEEHLLAMLGGLPKERTPLHPRITGTIQMDGFRIEKLIFESLPEIYVSALVYVPEDGTKAHPAILVPAGHAANGKVHYQALCQRLVQRGYVVISWDPVGQGERSQFWDAKAGKSRYNLICAEHAILGNLAYLAGANLARWEIWDGIRAVDYLLTRPEVDPQRINITGTSGGGFQAAHIAALDRRIKVAAPSCYITALPMRMYNRIFQDPDSDPEQDLYGMISNQIDNAGLLLMMYPRPVFVSAGVLDFFPIEGAHKAVREVTELYSMFHHADRIGMAEGYHAHEYSLENQEATIDFLDHFNGMPAKHGFAPIRELDEKTLRCTKTGQVMLEFEDARSLMDLIREYYEEHRSLPGLTFKQLYNSEGHPRIDSWSVPEFRGEIPAAEEVRWEARETSQFEGMTIEKYLLHHSRYLEMPLLYIHKIDGGQRSVVLWLGENGKATAKDWPSLMKYMDAGYDVVSFDPRGLGETRMPYKAASPDDPSLAQLNFDEAYLSPISGVLAGYVYNSILTGRPYFLQMVEDAEIATRFVQSKVDSRAKIAIAGTASAYTLASAISEALPGVKLLSSEGQIIKWSELVNQKTELWPIQYLLPGGAYIH